MTVQLVMKSLCISVADRERRFRLAVPRLHLRAGEVVGISGPSGTGKTMLLEVLGLIRRHTSGNYHLEQERESLDLVQIWGGGTPRPPEVRAKHFGFVPQSGGLLPFLTVAENIALSQRIAGRENDDRRQELVERLDLGDIQSQRPGTLSFGQRQRVAIARALAHDPAFVIADEPTAALDPSSAETAMGLLIEAATIGGAGVIISSHDLALLDRFPMRRLALALSGSVGASEVHCTLGELGSAA